MARRKRPKDARQLNAWLSPEALHALETWTYEKRYVNRTAALEAILLAVGRRLEEAKPDRPDPRSEPAHPPAERRTVPPLEHEEEPMPPVEILHDGGEDGATIARYTEPEPLFEEELPDNVWTGDTDGPPKGHPAWTDLYCDVDECRRRQWLTPGGAICDNGHGGASGSPWDEDDEAIKAAYQTDTHHQRTNWRALEEGRAEDEDDSLFGDVGEEDDIP